MRYIINPESRRLIEIGKGTYNRLLRDKKISKRTTEYEFPKSNVRWHDQVPMATNARRKMHKKCGRCFLVPPGKGNRRPRYPICSPNDANTCSVSCQGLKAALQSALRTKDTKVYNRALRLLKQYCKA